MCARLEAGIEGATHAVGQQRVEEGEGDTRGNGGQGSCQSEEEEEEGWIVSGLSNLIIETAGTEEEAAEGLAEALGI